MKISLKTNLVWVILLLPVFLKATTRVNLQDASVSQEIPIFSETFSNIGDTIFQTTTTNICLGDSIEIFGQFQSMEGDYIRIDDSGSSVQVITVHLEYYEEPDIVVRVEDISCFGEQNGGVSIETADTGLLYALGDGAFMATSSFTNLDVGAYELHTQTVDECVFTNEISLSEPDELRLDLGPDININFGDFVDINPAVNSIVTLSEWSPTEGLSCMDCFNISVNPLETTLYTLRVTAENGCTAEDDIIINVDNTRNVYIPNVFSPNNDGTNDVFIIHGGRNVESIVTLKIYNYWEMLVFNAEAIAPNSNGFGWDGKFEGEHLTSSVYTYYAEILFTDGEVEVFTGTVLLLR